MEKPPPYTPVAPPYGLSAGVMPPQPPPHPPGVHVHYPSAPPLPCGVTYGSVTMVQPALTQTVITSRDVIVVGGCPACRIGVLDDEYTLCGVLCAILFFPLGILCCLASRYRKCSNCRAVFD